MKVASNLLMAIFRSSTSSARNTTNLFGFACGYVSRNHSQACRSFPAPKRSAAIANAIAVDLLTPARQCTRSGLSSEGECLLHMLWFGLDIAQHGHIDIMKLENQLWYHISPEWILCVWLFNRDDS